MQQLPVRLIVWLVDIVVNAYYASDPRAVFSFGSLHLNNVAFIVVFNASLIMGIYATDLFIVTMRRLNTRIKIGERVITGHVHEE